MMELRHESHDLLVIYLEGNIDTTNALEYEESILKIIENNNCLDKRVSIDFSDVSYVSSAGLRAFLRLKKQVSLLQIENASNEVYEVFEMTGFTSIIDVYKRLKFVSTKNLKLLGEGYVGKVYRLDEERIIKVFVNYDSVDDIYRERAMAKKAFMLGIPTAISYEIVKTENNRYGAIYELLKSDCLNTILAKNPNDYQKYSDMYTSLIKEVIETNVPVGTLPDKKKDGLMWVEGLRKYNAFEKGYLDKLEKMINELPNTNTMVHGDLHVKNIMMQNNEPVLIDMETLGSGHPIFELSAIFLSYYGYGATVENNTEDFLGIPTSMAHNLFEDTILKLYGNRSKELIQEIKDKITLLSYAWLCYKTYIYEPENKVRMEHSKEQVLSLINKINTLEF